MKAATRWFASVAAMAAISATYSAAQAAVTIGDWTGSPTTSVTITFNDEGIGTADTPLTEFFNTNPSSPFFGQSMGFASHDVTAPTTPDGAYTFTDTFKFALPTGFLGGSGTSHHSTVGTSAQQALVNLDFTGGSFKGLPITFINGTATDATRTFHFDDTSITIGGDQTLILSGVGGPNASYAGTLTFTPELLAGIPEPATWGLMIVGFGGLGALLRTRRRALALALS